MNSATLSPVIVLDTNVCLDLFVFHDPRWNELLHAIKEGKVRAITRSDCRKEWEIVLTYPHLPLTEATRKESAAEFDALIALLPDSAEPHEHAIRLPVCSDPDDQKFLETAQDAGAQILITKDKALLKLARKTARLGLFQIMLPELWLRHHAETALPVK